MGILLAVIIFSAIVLFHELGHFLLAKKNGIIVEEFSLGLGPKIFKMKKGGTEYCIKLLPFGGSCMMKGEDGTEDEEGTFNHCSVWGRISVIAAGPIFNFILAFVVAAIIIGVVGYDPAVVTEVERGSKVEEAGLQSGDLITEFQGSNVDISRDISTALMLNGLKETASELTFIRDGKEHSISYTPEPYDRYMLGFSYDPAGTNKITEISKGLPLDQAGVKPGDIITKIDGTAVSNKEEITQYFDQNPLKDKEVTVTYERDNLEYEAKVTPKLTKNFTLGFNLNMDREKIGSLGVLKYSVIEVKYWVKTTLLSLGKLITGQFSVNDLAGPVGVVNIIDDTYEESKSQGGLMVSMSMLNLMILLSANLGVMNLLPLPALDGGRLVFLIIEAIRKKPIKREVEGMVHFVGLVLLMLLMVFVMFNDIRRLF